MSPELPPPLREAIERQLQGVSRKALAERAARTSAAYRAGRGSAGVIREPHDALAYALARLPATYAACAAAFAELRRLAPGFAPHRLLDAGAGPGAASWAALEVWPGLSVLSWIDASPTFLELAARLASHGPEPLRRAERRRLDLTASGQSWPPADLVVASYALAEIAPERLAQVVADLWSACEGALVLIEPGTPAGFARLGQARTALLAQDARLVAPCPHAGDCPLTGGDWCHFSVRLPRSRDHRLAKGAEVPFEDERFAYLVVARPSLPVSASGPRVIAPPRAGKPGVELRLCAPQGLETRFIGRRDRAAYAVARRLAWGDTVG